MYLVMSICILVDCLIILQKPAVFFSKIESTWIIPWRREQQILPKKYISFKLQDVLLGKSAVWKGDTIFLFPRVPCELKVSSGTVQFIVLERTSPRVFFSLYDVFWLQWAIIRPCIKIYQWGNWMVSDVLSCPAISPFHKHF